MRDIEHPSITHVNKTGHTSEDWQALQRKTLAENRYMEDIFGREIKIGDNYIETERGELVHEQSAFDYLCDLYIKNTR